MNKTLKKVGFSLAAILLLSAYINFTPFNLSGVSTVDGACGTTEECNAEIKRLEEEREKKQAEISGYEDTTDGIQNKIFGLQEERDLIDSQITALDNSISAIDGEIKTLEESITKKHEEIRNRMERMQLAIKGNQYLDFLINSESLTDLIRRADAVESITSYDKDLISQISAEKAQVVAFQEQQAEQRKQQESKKTETETLIAEQQQLQADFKAKIAAAQSSASDLELSQGEVQAQIDKLEELRKQQEEEEKNNNNNNNGGGGEENGGGNESGGGGSGVPSGSGWVLPTASGTVTCSYGCYYDHIGTDIGKYGGTNVLAAATGIVVYTAGGCYEGNRSCNGGFGNVIAISHRINGRDYVTVYAHLQSIYVSEWQTVSAGQSIGYMGNTGDSYGTHLHFEVLVDINYMPGSKATRRAHSVDSVRIIPYPNGGSEWSSSW
ncbi:murein hydrolase activator EnvC family protein [Culicoidibacter larvae]|nr:peptidoglycan DD-metalloendopeptidase family protein [Culicoidibacter larvae]